MRLYHGSVVEVRKPSLRYARKKTDFGRGFYTTTQKEQAEHWTTIKIDRAKDAKRKVVSVYEFDEAILAEPDINIREFKGADEAWLNFVVDSRKGIQHDYDLVFGPVANDKVFTVVNLYESGVLDAPAAISELKAYKTYNQLSFHSKRVLDALKFVESYDV
ncbi:MAG: DUF3990 domain-containing protein [Bacteroidales bacterium]|nr:DUF3990 domain-containing protein [Bacteroidales bacterium]MBQ7458603.1 DUF3990 domain-containing protein [Bacteroidales bacterium]